MNTYTQVEMRLKALAAAPGSDAVTLGGISGALSLSSPCRVFFLFVFFAFLHLPTL